MVRVGAYRRWKVQKFWPEHNDWHDFAMGYKTQEDAEKLADELRVFKGAPRLRVVAEDYYDVTDRKKFQSICRPEVRVRRHVRRRR